ncbi:hypothetical protein EGI22_19460 [Lacihabitans sp. LS3-19]|uniref:T9SS type B sorting domain-containing protein n=1 Tax=Lacihabitans sp. LS3-19 TaxID=2487335 RepID=UPI0020CF2455|nr:gliding motility-associated C-terminal domain-containing protein [Lacihabitans sp. LS3-19]MCP9770087.1 hypothetical protein [Lacihabitans sp. LS3-19]
MPQIINKAIKFIVCLLVVHGAIAQNPPPKPKICTTPTSGYLFAGDMSIAPPISCVGLGGSTLTNVVVTNKRDAATGITVDNPIFYFDVDDNFDINTSTKGVPGVGNKVTQPLDLGFHWILMKGDKNGNKYLSCILQENIRTIEPTVTASACGGNTVTLTIPDAAENKHNRYTIDWGDGTTAIINTASTPLPLERKKTYPGTPNDIKIQGIYIRNGSQVCPTNFKLIQPDAGSSTLIHTLDGENGGKEAKLQFVGFVPGETYDIMVAPDNGVTNTFTKLAEGLNGNATITGLDPNAKYCFKIKSKNSCGLDVFSVNTICSVNLKPTIKSSSSIDLKWNTPTEPNGIPSKLSIARDVKGCTSCLNNIPFTNPTATTYSDNTVDCANIYLFRVAYKYPVISFNGTDWPINIRSAQVEVNMKSNQTAPKPNYLVQVGFDPNDEQMVRINIVTDPNTSLQNIYKFYRAENDSQNFIPLGERNTNVFDDVAISADVKSYCYKYLIEDKCGVTTELSDPFCTISLSSKSQGMLNWTPYLIPPDIFTSSSPVDYSLEYFDEGLSSFIPLQTTEKLEESVQELLNSSGQSEIKFRVMGRQYVTTDLYTDQFINSYSNPFILKVPPGIYIPTAFTPDGQGPAESEIFKINGKFVSTGSFKIFDRWGGTIFEANSLSEAWDGTQQNGLTPAPPGTYAYTVYAVSDTGEVFTKTGSVLLLR